MVDSVIPVKQSNQYQQTTSQSSSSTNNGRNYQAQLKEAQEQNKNIQQDYDQKCADYDQKDVDNISLQDTLQVECTEKLQLASTLTEKGKELKRTNKKNNADLEKEIETQGSEIATLLEQNEKSEKDIVYWKSQKDNVEQKAVLHAMEDFTRGKGTKRKYNGDEQSASVARSSSKRSNVDTASSTTILTYGEMIMKQLLVEKDHHSKLMKQLLDTREQQSGLMERLWDTNRWLRIAKSREEQAS